MPFHLKNDYVIAITMLMVMPFLPFLHPSMIAHGLESRTILPDATNGQQGITWLHTDGRHIKNARNETTTLKGVAWMELLWQTTLDQDIVTRTEQMSRYNVRLVRLCLNPHYWRQSSYVALVDRIVSELQERNIYLILDFMALGSQTPKWSNEIAMKFMQNPSAVVTPSGTYNVTNWFVEIAARYKDIPAVAFYELLGQPLTNSDYPVDQLEPAWYSNSLHLTKAIHAANPRAIVLVPSVSASRIQNGFLLSPLPEPNVVYTVHRYYHYDIPWQQYAKSYAAGGFGVASEQQEKYYHDVVGLRMLDNPGKPVMVVEFGASPQDPNWARQVSDLYDLLERHEISWVQWVWHPGDAVQLSLVGNDWHLTSPGMLWSTAVGTLVPTRRY